MKINFSTKMLELYELTGEIGALSEHDIRYVEIYMNLSNALDIAEQIGLITYEENNDE